MATDEELWDGTFCDGCNLPFTGGYETATGMVDGLPLPVTLFYCFHCGDRMPEFADEGELDDGD